MYICGTVFVSSPARRLRVLIAKQCLLRGWCKLYPYFHFSPA
ncbi:hypothetical protein T07_11645 [Trichinella nelsoni]|uniref:Uncharacterized protein n=1 Tax=Trichinella nelsoni TaxID=6336 RepID=A0A0V0RAG1_9BILA|nr:hypothetical protein T07_11645 [Trichinella nelsoni]